MAKSNWRTRNGFAVIALLLILGTFEFLSITKIAAELNTKILVAGVVVFCFFVYWSVKSGRLSLPSGRISLLLSMKIDEDSEKYYRSIKQALESRLVDLDLKKKIRLAELGTDVISDNDDANRFAIQQGVDLVVWGDVLSAKKEGIPYSKFKLRYTFRHKRLPLKLFGVFLADVGLSLIRRKDDILDKDSYGDIIALVEDVLEPSLFIIGLALLVGNEYARAYEILTKLRDMLLTATREHTDTVRTVLLGRVNALLIEILLGQGDGAFDFGRFQSAKKFYEDVLAVNPENLAVCTRLALICYKLGDIGSSKRYTSRAEEISKGNLFTLANEAFYALIELKWDTALSKYKKFETVPSVPFNVLESIAFLDEEYIKTKNKGLLFAIGFFNILFVDRKEGRKTLESFIKRVKTQPEFSRMISYARHIVSKDIERKSRKVRYKHPR